MQDTAAVSAAYDEVAYPSSAIELTAPERLCAVGLLRGWRTADPARARVLEIGCGAGRNLLSIAALTPGARCVGFDISSSAIAAAQSLAARAGIGNATFEVADILAYPHEGEQFDYIICHGVYTWTPEHVRQPLLALARARLAPGGVLYVSYDALPLAAPKKAVNVFMRRVLAEGDPVRASQGAALLLRTLRENQHGTSVLAPVLQAAEDALDEHNLDYLYHDWLAEFYDPVSISDLAGAAGSAGLAYAGDIRMFDLFNSDLTPRGLSLMNSFRGLVERNELLDLLRGDRFFRQDMFVRHDAPPPPEPDGLGSLFFSLLGEREERALEDGTSEVRFTNENGAYASLPEGTGRTLMDLVHHISPAEVPYSILAERAGAGVDELAPVIRALASLGILQVHATPQPFVTDPGPRPTASPLVRVLAETEEKLPTLRHTAIIPDEPELRAVLGLCDGTRDRDRILAELSARWADLDRARLDVLIATAARSALFEPASGPV
jgi:SAM-dependent methyltransferase